jgi:putative two-component system response regulator
MGRFRLSVGIKGENIPLPARIMAIIDVYDALVSERPYKKAFSREEAIKIIKDGEDSHFDPYLAEIFITASKYKGSFPYSFNQFQ